MRFTVSAVSAALAMASSALAQTAGFDAVNVPAPGQQIPAGSQFTIEWDVPANYASGTVSLQLIGGQTQGTQIPLSMIATGVANSAGKFVWSVDSALGGLPFYGLIIRSESSPDVYQYSNPFQIVVAPSQSSTAASQPTAAGSTTITTSNQSKTVILSSAVPTSADASGAVTVTVDATTTVCGATTLTTKTREPVATPVVTPVDGGSAGPTGATSPAPSSPAAPAPPAGEASPAPVGEATGAPAAGTGGLAPGAAQTSSWNPPANPPVPTAVPSGVTVSGATRATGSMALIGGLVLAFFAL